MKNTDNADNITKDPTTSEAPTETNSPNTNNTVSIATRLTIAVRHNRRWYCPFFYLIIIPLYSMLGATVVYFIEAPQQLKAYEDWRNYCSRFAPTGLPSTSKDLDSSEFERLIDKLGRCAKHYGWYSTAPSWENNVTCDGTLRQAREDAERMHYCFTTYVTEPLNAGLRHYWNATGWAMATYTMIGYGNSVAYSVKGRVFTIAYAWIGVALFLAFVEDWGILFSALLIAGARHCKFTCKRLWKRHKQKKNKAARKEISDESLRPLANVAELMTFESDLMLIWHRKFPFALIILAILIYMLLLSLLTDSLDSSWNLLQSSYFVIQGLLAVGHGDVVPSDACALTFIHLPLSALGTVAVWTSYLVIRENIRFFIVTSQQRLRQRRPLNHLTEAQTQQMPPTMSNLKAIDLTRTQLGGHNTINENNGVNRQTPPIKASLTPSQNQKSIEGKTSEN